MNEPSESRGEVILNWWSANIANRGGGRARALAARLRRADSIETLVEPEVHDLARALHLQASAAERLVRLAQVLAEVRNHDRKRLAQCLGGQDPALSPLRFQRLLRARGDEFTTALRRALPMADRKCNVAALGADLLDWDRPDLGDGIRAKWCFDYFSAQQRNGADATEQTLSETDQ